MTMDNAMDPEAPIVKPIVIKNKDHLHTPHVQNNTNKTNISVTHKSTNK